MKMVMPIINANSNPGSITITESAIHFDELRQGVHQARCRFDFVPGGSPATPGLTLSRIANLTITSEASDNSKGRRRVLVKVDVPYARFAAVDPTNPVTADKLPTNFGDVSAHIVLSIPAGMKADCESTDRISRASAEACIQLVLGVLLNTLGANVGVARRCLTDEAVIPVPNLSVGKAEMLDLLHGEHTEPGYAYVIQASGAESAKLSTPEPGTDADPVTGLPILTIRCDNRYDQHSHMSGDGRGILSDANSPLARGLAGLVPIEENATVYVPVEYQTPQRASVPGE